MHIPNEHTDLITIQELRHVRYLEKSKLAVVSGKVLGQIMKLGAWSHANYEGITAHLMYWWSLIVIDSKWLLSMASFTPKAQAQEERLGVLDMCGIWGHILIAALKNVRVLSNHRNSRTSLGKRYQKQALGCSCLLLQAGPWSLLVDNRCLWNHSRM